MYSTIVIWLAFLPIFSVIKENVRLNMFTISCCISGSALTTLVLLFFPKVYIIILHPEKNVRQQMKPFSSTGNLKRSQPNSASQMSSQIALPQSNLNGHLTLHPNTNGLKFAAEMTSSSNTATDFPGECYLLNFSLQTFRSKVLGLRKSKVWTLTIFSVKRLKPRERL